MRIKIIRRQDQCRRFGRSNISNSVLDHGIAKQATGRGASRNRGRYTAGRCSMVVDYAKMVLPIHEAERGQSFQRRLR